jgi:hypothetical protein
MNESVYSLIPPTPETRVPPPMYRSKHRKLAPTCSTFGFQGTSKVIGNVAGGAEDAPPVHPSVKATGSFGKVVQESVNPQDFLKRSNDHMASKSGHTFQRTKPAVPKAAVPSKADKPVMGLTTDKNFVVANAVESILTPPKRQTVAAERAVDKPSFGQVPDYLHRVKADLKTKQQTAADAAALHDHEDEYEVLTDAEVDDLRRSLNARHSEFTKQYQTLSFTLETGSQKKRKEQLEKALADVEGMLKKLNKRRVVVVDK